MRTLSSFSVTLWLPNVFITTSLLSIVFNFSFLRKVGAMYDSWEQLSNKIRDCCVGLESSAEIRAVAVCRRTARACCE